MKKLLTVTLLSVVMTNFLFSQNFTKMSSSIITGDVQEISNLLDENVEVSILDNDSYTKAEAEVLLASFFSDKENSEFKAIHKGATNGDAYYQIGELKTNKDIYRTYIYSKEIDGNYIVQEFRIEK